MKKPTPALKGRKRIVQGKARSAAAPGHASKKLRSPEGAKETLNSVAIDYSTLVGGIGELLEIARRTSARAVNALMTATYWEIGRRIVEFEQSGKQRAKYGEQLLDRLAEDLNSRYGRGFSRRNLQSMRQFYVSFPLRQIWQTLSAKSSACEKRATPPLEFVLPRDPETTSAESSAEICQTLSGESGADSIWQTASAKSAALSIPSTPANIFQTPSGISGAPSRNLRLVDPRDLARAFPLPWSHYILLISRSRSPEALDFYHTEALSGGWSVRQLRRQMDSQFYERTALSRNKVAMLAKGAKPQPGDAVTAEEEIKDPFVLEFLGLRDEYSESELEDALIRHLQHFLLELGNDFAFVARQRRLRIDDEWYRVDLLLFHRRLRCLVVIDLKLGRFTHADAGQMHLYLNYAAQHWTQPGENPPVGIILCAAKGDALVRYATENLPTKILVRDYLTALPDEKRLAAEITAARRKLENRATTR